VTRRKINTKAMNETTFLLLCLLTVTTCFGQSTDKYAPFKSSDYSTDKYQIKLDRVRFSKFKIEIRQAKLLDNKINTPSDFYCRGWVTITQGSIVIKQLYFKEIEPVGGCSGLFIPDKQPKDHFIISKFGDYDGRIFIIDTTGKVQEKMGGIFYISKDQRYLFSSYDSDLSGLTVYDLNKKLILFSGTIEPYLGDWYFKDRKYFAEIQNPLANAIDSCQIAIFDFSKNKLTISEINKDYLKEDNKLKMYNDVVHDKDCNCGR
jgi:hypothetical protein